MTTDADLVEKKLEEDLAEAAQAYMRSPQGQRWRRATAAEYIQHGANNLPRMTFNLSGGNNSRVVLMIAEPVDGQS